MTAQSIAMSPDTHPLTTKRSNLFRKLVLLVLLLAASALGLQILFRAKPDYPWWLQNWFAVVSLAVVAGFGARWVLNRRSGFIRFVVAMATYIFGLYLLGFISGWKYGLGPLEFWSKQVNVEGLIQVGIGFFIFILVFLAWRRRSPAMTKPAVPIQKAPTIPPAMEAKPVGKPRPASAKVGDRKPILGFLRREAKPVKISPGRQKPLKKSVKPLTEAELPIRPRRRSLFRSKPKVQLAIVEEHRCPYCLEPVSRVDPRGVVECDVCHTLHHKDCWDITGVCQVPHMNS